MWHCCGQLWVWHMFCNQDLWWAIPFHIFHWLSWDTLWIPNDHMDLSQIILRNRPYPPWHWSLVCHHPITLGWLPQTSTWSKRNFLSQSFSYNLLFQYLCKALLARYCRSLNSLSWGKCSQKGNVHRKAKSHNCLKLYICKVPNVFFKTDR